MTTVLNHTTPMSSVADDQRPVLLLVEDDPNLGMVLQEYLEIKGFEVVHCADGESALQTALQRPFTLGIFDIMLPRKDGFTLAREIREADQQLPIIFLTARGRVEDRIEGFQAGGDDYLTKPFSMEELMLRINAILKRMKSAAEAPRKETDLFQLGALSFDFKHRILTGPEGPQSLTTREAELLRLLAQNQGTVVRRDVALKMIWGDDSYYNARSMDVFISKLRKYLAPDERIRLMNVHGVGYKLLLD